MYVDKDNFNNNKFNQMYEQNRLSSIYDKGYGDNWDEEMDDNVVFDKKFNLDVFNSVFNDNKQNRSKKKNKQVMIIDQPEPQVSTNLQFEELGLDEISNFSSSNQDKMAFTDYKAAYTNNNVLNMMKNLEEKILRILIILRKKERIFHMICQMKIK